MNRGLLKQTMTCSSCAGQMILLPCAASKSTDLHVWKCQTCNKFTNIRTESILSGKKLSFKTFLTLLFYLCIRSLTNVEVSALVGVSTKAVGEWRTMLSNAVADWFLHNSSPLGGPGKVVEVDEAKFGKRKFSRGSYREGMWVLGGVDRETGQCFLVPCPGNARGADVLLPIIQRWVLPGSIVYTDEWGAYNNLPQHGYTHDSVSHTIQFVDPTTGVHTNASAGETQIANAFNGYLEVLKVL